MQSVTRGCNSSSFLGDCKPNRLGNTSLHHTILYYTMPITGAIHVCNVFTHQWCAICPAEVILHCLVVQPDPLVVLCICCVRKKSVEMLLYYYFLCGHRHTFSLTHSQLTNCCSSGVMMLTRWAFKSRQRCSASSHISLSVKCR